MEHQSDNIMEVVLSERDMSALRSKDLLASLSRYINELITHQFNDLISLLYRLDINENKLKDLLQNHATEDASQIIATLIIERQQQKIKSREMFRFPEDIPGEDRW